MVIHADPGDTRAGIGFQGKIHMSGCRQLQKNAGVVLVQNPPIPPPVVNMPLRGLRDVHSSPINAKFGKYDPTASGKRIFLFPAGQNNPVTIVRISI